MTQLLPLSAIVPTRDMAPPFAEGDRAVLHLGQFNPKVSLISDKNVMRLEVLKVEEETYLLLAMLLNTFPLLLPLYG